MVGKNIDTDRVMEKFMLITMIGSIIGFIWFEWDIAPLIVVWLCGGMLVIVGGTWILQEVK